MVYRSAELGQHFNACLFSRMASWPDRVSSVSATAILTEGTEGVTLLPAAKGVTSLSDRAVWSRGSESAGAAIFCLRFQIYNLECPAQNGVSFNLIRFLICSPGVPVLLFLLPPFFECSAPH